METIAGVIIASIVIAVSGFVFSRFMMHIIDSNKDLKTYIDDKISKVEKENSELKDSINDIFKNNSRILDEILIKFSSWEDRIKNIIDNHLSKEIKNNGVNNYLERTLETELRDLDDRTKNDIDLIRKKLQSVKKDVSNLSGKLSSQDKIETFYSSKKVSELDEISLKIAEIDELHNKHFESINSNNRKLFMLCKKIVSDYKDIIAEIEKLKTGIRELGKIKLIDGKDRGQGKT